jgi:hypothetical protein
MKRVWSWMNSRDAEGERDVAKTEFIVIVFALLQMTQVLISHKIAQSVTKAGTARHHRHKSLPAAEAAPKCPQKRALSRQRLCTNAHNIAPAPIRLQGFCGHAEVAIAESKPSRR